MNEQIKRLLEQVGLGELTEAEAEKQYLHLIQLETEKGGNRNRFDTGHIISTEPDPLADRIEYCERMIECINPLENPEYRLFIFLPFGFGNETLSWSWKTAFNKQGNVEVWLMGASDISSWGRLVEHLQETMEPLCRIPFAVYGHSMGGIIAYEVLVALERRYQLSPVVFMPSSVSPPVIFERLKVLPPVYEIDSEMAMRECRDLLEKSQIILPLKSGMKPMSDEAIRCDLELIKTYRCRHVQPALSCRILALQANNDVLVKDPVSVSLWKDYTKGDFSLQEIEGSHLYFINPPRSLFAAIQSYFQPEARVVPAFKAKTYRLVSFEAGTEEVHVYPYGIRPKGYLIYQQDGKMAAHLWNSVRRSLSVNSTKHSSAQRDTAERLLSYLSYTGYYHQSQGVIEHTVHASSDPNFDQDCLTRYYRIDDNRITLMTAPLTTKDFRQSKSSAFCKLVWEEVGDEAEYSGHWIVGSWLLSSYREDNKPVMGDCPEGILIMTAEGYFSIVVVDPTRNRPHYDNLILASEEELNEAVRSCRSYCGRFELIDETTLVFQIEEGVFDAETEQIVMRFGIVQQGFEFQWKRDQSDRLRVHCKLRRFEAKRLPMSQLSEVDVDDLPHSLSAIH